MGTVSSSPLLAAELDHLAKMWPLGARIVHTASGREGVIALDNPENVPGEFHGRPTAWCVLDSGHDAVCMRWQLQIADVPAITWVRTDRIRLADHPATNRPGLQATKAGAR